MRLSQQILLWTFIPLIVLAGFSLFQVERVLSKLHDEVAQRLEAKKSYVIESLDEKEKLTTYVADLLSGSVEIIDAIEAKDSDLTYIWGKKFLKIGITRVTFLDKDGVVISRAHDEFKFGDSMASFDFFKRTKDKEKISTFFIDKSDCEPRALVAYPVLRHEEIFVGAIIVETLLDEKTLRDIGSKRTVKLEIIKEGSCGNAENSLDARSENIVFTYGRDGGRFFDIRVIEEQQGEHDKLYALGESIFLVTLAVFVSVLVFSYFLIKRSLVPAYKLVAKLKNYSGGHSGIDELLEATKMLSSNRSEFGDISNSLNQMLSTLKETQEQLIESEKMASLGGLVAGVSHEINTPLGICVTAASHLDEKNMEIAAGFKTGNIKKSNFEEYLDNSRQTLKIIMSNLNRASELVRSFKEVSVDQSSENKRDFELKEYLSEVILSIKPRLKKSSHKVEMDCEHQIFCVTYPGAISQIITNFIVNSLVHAFNDEKPGTIRIAAYSSDENVNIVYKDDGGGMNEEVRSKIFEPFFTTKRGKGGTGLGMHIVYNLITQKLKGKIVCESKEGDGTTFVVTFPAVI